MHYYQFNIADYRKDTQHLTPIEHYIYRELMDWYYLDENPIPQDIKLITRRLRLGSENDQYTIDVLQEFFNETENGWEHGRINREIQSYKGMCEANRINGSKGGRPTKPKKTQPVKIVNPNESEINPNHKPLTNNHNKEKKKKNGRFAPPSLTDIQNYIQERRYSVNGKSFFAHYESNGWMVGKNKMKDWQAAIRGWQARDNDKEKPTVQLPRKQYNADGSERILQ